jgi:ribonuclease Z
LKPETLQLGDLRLEGASRAGTETWLRVHPPGLAFEAGRGALPLAGARDVVLSHGHLDHALGVPFVLSQRSLHQHAGTRVFCPAAIAGDLAAFIAAAARMEGAEYDFELVGLAPGQRVEVGKGMTVEAFAGDHVVPSLGYHLFCRRKRLRQDLAGAPREELLARRAAGEEITDTVEHLALSYLGDTGPGIFASEPRLFTARVLVAECTFVGDELRHKGALYKHLHVADFAERAERFANEAIVLLHLSRRHRRSDLLAEVALRMPALADRVHVLLGEEG